MSEQAQQVEQPTVEQQEIKTNPVAETMTQEQIDKGVEEGRLIPLVTPRKEIFFCGNRNCNVFYERTLPAPELCPITHVDQGEGRHGHCHFGHRMLTRSEIIELAKRNVMLE